MNRWVRSICLMLLMVGSAPVAWSQQITSVSVTVTGIGKQEDEALAKALVRAIAQVNGEAIASQLNIATQSDESSQIRSDGTAQSSFKSKLPHKSSWQPKPRGSSKHGKWFHLGLIHLGIRWWRR